MFDELIWILVNLVLPVAAPSGGMWLERASAKNIRDAVRRETELRARRFIFLFKDGQLGWVGVLMCFAAISDTIDGIRRHGLPEITAIALIALCLLVFFNGHFAAKGVVENSEALDEFSWGRFVSDYPVMFHTTVGMLATAVLFTCVHFWAQ